MDDVGGDSGQSFPWELGVFDAHCHPTDTLANLPAVPQMRARVLTIMATRAQDQELVAEAARKYGVFDRAFEQSDGEWRTKQKIVPAFGWHPWFSHQMFDENEYEATSGLSMDQKMNHFRNVLVPMPEDESFLQSLPDPKPFGHFLDQTRSYLHNHPLALVGEVGLDRSFRIPEAWLPGQVDQRDDSLTPGGREGRRLSPYRVSIDHQKKVLRAQLKLAAQMHRAVSVHGVQAHGIVYETLADTWKGQERHVPSKKERRKQGVEISESDQNPMSQMGPSPKPYPPRICLHSFSGPAETVKQYLQPSTPCEIYFSFSTTINSWTEGPGGKVEAAVKAVPDNRVLVESDLHTAGRDMDHYLQEVVRKICEVKGWELRQGVMILGNNWRSFVFGNDT